MPLKDLGWRRYASGVAWRGVAWPGLVWLGVVAALERDVGRCCDESSSEPAAAMERGASWSPRWRGASWPP